MLSFLQKIKNDIIVNGKLNISALIYILATPIGLMACYSSIKIGLSILDNSTEFHMANLWIALSNTLVFGFKMPYTTDKPIAFTAFILNFIGWLIALIILIVA